MNEVFEQVERRPYSLQPVSADVLRGVWDALCELLYRTLANGKGFGMPNFGVWTFRADHRDLGNTKKTIKTPAFVLSEKFARTYSINYRKPLVSGGVPVTNLNLLNIASIAGFSRDEATAALKDIFLYVGDVARAGRMVQLYFNNVGYFTCSNGNATFQFDSSFSGSFETSGFSTRAPIHRPLSAPSRRAAPIDWSASTPVAGSKRAALSSLPPAQIESRPSTAGSVMGSARHRPSPHQQQQQQQSNGIQRFNEGGAENDTYHQAGVMRPMSSSGITHPPLPRPSRSRPSTSQGPSHNSPHNNTSSSNNNNNNNSNNTGMFDRTTSTVGGGTLNNQYAGGGGGGGDGGNGPVPRRMHSKLCRCKWCIVRENYNQQVEEKYAKMGAEERVDQELIKLSLARNELMKTREKREESLRRSMRLEIEQFNSDIRDQYLEKKQQFGPLPFEDMFQHKIAEQRAVLNKDEIRNLLDGQVELKREMTALEKEMERAANMADVDKATLEVEKEREAEERRQAVAKRRADLEAQIKSKRSVITDPVTSAVWDAIPRIKPADLEDKRDRQKRMQEDVLAQLRERELAREREKEEEARRVQDEVRRLQETIERTEMLRQKEEAAKKAKAREVWTAQISQRKMAERKSRRPLSGSTGFIVGNDEGPRHGHLSSEIVPVSAVLLSQTLPFR